MKVPPRFRKAKLEELVPEQFRAVLNYNKGLLGGKGIGLLVCGPPGVGKTHALAALTLRWADRARIGERKLSGEFVTAPTFFENLDPFNDDAWDTYRDQSWLDTYSRVDWLVINDLGKEDRAGKLEKQKANRLGRVLRARSEALLITHITTNLDGPGMKEAYGESIVSLLSEMTIPVIVDGPDRRKL